MKNIANNRFFLHSIVDSTKIYIPISILSVIIILASFWNIYFDDPDSANYSQEIEKVIHYKLDLNLTTEQLETLKNSFPNLKLRPENSTDYILLFISGSDPCSNCLNEISDYLELVNKTKFLAYNFTSLLVYHGTDKRQADRFILSSQIADRVDDLSFIRTSDLHVFDYGNFSETYGAQNQMYLIENRKNTVFHGFLLPSGSTTMLESKEISFSDALANQITDN